MRLADFITTHREAILQEFEDFARTRTTVGDAMTVAALRDHAAGMLEAIAVDLRHPQTAAAQRRKSLGDARDDPDAPTTAAEHHGHERRVANFTLDEAVAEFRALRASVLRLWSKAVGAPADEESIQDMVRFNEAVDQALAESTAHFSLEHERLHREKQAVARQLGALIEGAPLGIYLVDSRFRISHVNPVAEPVFGGASVIGRDFEEVIRELWEADYADEVVRIFRQTLETGEPRYEPERAELRADRGVREYYEWRVDRIPMHGGEYGVACYFRDISEAVRARKAVADSEERYRTLFDSIDAGLCIIKVLFDGDGAPIDFIYTETNPAFASHAGLTNVEGKRVRELVPDYDDYWPRVYGEVVRTGEPARRERFTPSFNRWFDVYAFPIGRPEEHKVGVLFRDSTAQRQAEEALRQSDRRKSEFLATLSHELRSPLAAIRTSIPLLGAATSDPTSVRTVAAILDRQSGALVRLVDDLLDVSRISLGKVNLERRPLDLRDVVRDVVNDAAPICEEKGLALTSAVPDQPLTVDADPVRLAQVVNNLLNNAVKYTPRGGEVSVNVERAGEEVRVGVSDTGVGLTQEQLTGVFEMFVQGERHSEVGAEGLGIGLSLAQSIVEMHGGSIEARSDGRGLGSEFLVTLPAAGPVPEQPEAPTSGQEEDLPERPEEGKRVLVAEDNRDALRALVLALRMKGHHVDAAADGKEALRTVEARRPDAALLDIAMPGLDGYQVARRIRDAEWGKDMLLIAITGWGQEEDQRKAREAGFDRHVTKPADPSVLDELIRSAARGNP